MALNSTLATSAATVAAPPRHTSAWTSLAFYLRGGLRGYDFFISYSRADATAYVLVLSQRLGEKKLTCYIDQWGSKPGANVPGPLLQKLRRSQVLLVVGSAQALDSVAMQQEIAVFADTGRPIVPIAFGSMQQAVWNQQVLGLAVTVETADALTEAQPSEAVVARASGSLSYTKQDSRIKRAIWGTIGLFVALGVTSILTLANARGKLATLDLELGQAMQRFKKANVALAQTNQRLATADERKKQADAALDSAKGQLLVTRKETEGIRVSLDQAQDSLANSIRSLALERERLRIEQNKLVLAQANAQKNLATLNKQAASASELVNHMEKGLGELYRQPSLERCSLDEVTSEHPLSVYMYMNRADLKNVEPTTLTALDKLVNCLKANPEYGVMVNGHLAEYIWRDEPNEDDVYALWKGTDEYKIVLGQRLADAVVNYLIKKGVPSNRITSTSYGDRRPRYKLIFLNNRVEISLAKASTR